MATVLEEVEHAPDASSDQQRVDLLVARIGRELFAIPVSGVEEVIEISELRSLEQNVPALLGVAPLRGRLLPIYRTDDVLGVAPRMPMDLVLVLCQGEQRLGIAVDDVEEVIGIDAASMRLATARGVDPRLVPGVVLHEGRLMTVLDSVALAARFTAAATTETA